MLQGITKVLGGQLETALLQRHFGAQGVQPLGGLSLWRGRAGCQGLQGAIGLLPLAGDGLCAGLTEQYGGGRQRAGGFPAGLAGLIKTTLYPIDIGQHQPRLPLVGGLFQQSRQAMTGAGKLMTLLFDARHQQVGCRGRHVLTERRQRGLGVTEKAGVALGAGIVNLRASQRQGRRQVEGSCRWCQGALRLG